MPKNIITIALCTAVFFLGCDEHRVFDDYQPVRKGWHKDSVLVFKVERPDSLKAYDLFINIRNNNEYDYNNLFLIAEMRFPHGKVVTDTLEYEMASPDGEWLGKGFGDIKESRLWYKEAVRFDEPGKYTFRIRQAMRKNGQVEGVQNLTGITHVGFRIEDHSEH